MRTRSTLWMILVLLLAACAPQPSAPPPPSNAVAEEHRLPPVPCAIQEKLTHSAADLVDRRFAVGPSRGTRFDCFRFVDDALSWAQELSSRDAVYQVGLCSTGSTEIGPDEYRITSCWWMTRFFQSHEKPYGFDDAHMAAVQGVEKSCVRNGDDAVCKEALRVLWEQK
ncbi:MAG TPA: hypothetical protein VKM54_16415 [Myxococcota bacterium]|nr:hypothetical protein [Myxococcota bacterium]